MSEALGMLKLLALMLLAVEFHAEVLGKDTYVGCYIRGFEGIEDGRCGTTAKEDSQ